MWERTAIRKTYKIPLLDLLICLSTAIDLVSAVVANHHKRVVYIAHALGSQLGFSQDQLHELITSGALHDIGAFSLHERFDILDFELQNPGRHAEIGYQFLRQFDPFTNIATLVRYHHARWDEAGQSEGGEIPIESHVLHLADRVDVLIDPRRHILGQTTRILQRITEHSGTWFVPEFVEALREVAEREAFWLDAVSPMVDQTLRRSVSLAMLELDLKGLEKLAMLFSRIIDYKSPFTSTHTSGVAAGAEALARCVGFSQTECHQMRIAGYLHDLGKLAVPAEILEKPARLAKDEFNVMRSHTFHTRRILESISNLDVITDWAASHHERLDGRGYPFHENEETISLGARIVAVADVFTALTEDRPYRVGMCKETVLGIMDQMVDKSELDPKIVALLKNQFALVNSARTAAQEAAREE